MTGSIPCGFMAFSKWPRDRIGNNFASLEVFSRSQIPHRCRVWYWDDGLMGDEDCLALTVRKFDLAPVKEVWRTVKLSWL